MNFSGVGTNPQALRPAGYEQITVSSAAKALTVPAGATRAVVGVEAQSIRVRDDAVDPTASIGFLVKADVDFGIIGPVALKAFRAIRATGSDSTLNVVYYK